MEREIVMYTRGGFCPDVSRARRNLQLWRLPYREINIREDPVAYQRCLEWNRCLAVPVVVIANAGDDLPIELPLPLELDRSPRDVDRGYMITEASTRALREFLTRHGFVLPAEA